MLLERVRATNTPTRQLPRLLLGGRNAVVWGGFTLFVVLGVAFLVRDALKYLDWNPAVYQRFWPQRALLAGHIVGASLCLMLAPFQFSARLRSRRPRVHRAIGWTYVSAAILSASLTFPLGFFSSCRMCIPPFAIWSVLLFIVTALAVLMAVRRRFDAHRQFMVRSWVLLNGFVIVRLDTHFPLPFPTGLEIDRPAMLIWAAWVVPLILTEMYLSWLPLARGRIKPVAVQ